MKKTLVLAAAAVAMMGVTAYANTPVTTFSPDQAKVQFEMGSYSGGDKSHQYGAALEGGLTDKWAAQYGYTHFDGLANLHELNGVYRINDTYNAYVGITNLDGNADSSDWGYKVGAIGHIPLGNRLQGFAKLGFGNKVKHELEVGATYNLNSKIDLNLSIDRHGFENGHANSLNFGVGYTF